ncbi:unnamed protein product [Lupinus luteus]|uniref:Uncharacterized protein n=1 Tax=Lupinus luteus TaxID=3873 RepID=A0AAV1WCH6_LUPLU
MRKLSNFNIQVTISIYANLTKNAGKNESIVVQKKLASADSIHSAASSNPNEVTQNVEIESTQKRKGDKMKRFRAVRTLMKDPSITGVCVGEQQICSVLNALATENCILLKQLAAPCLLQLLSWS